MASFIEFPIFTGVSGDLRPWISWLEDFFARERFTEMEKMNLAQSLLADLAEAWFYRNQKILPFSWEDLKFNLWLRFGDLADYDRFSQAIRDEARIQRRKTTSIPEKNSIWGTETDLKDLSCQAIDCIQDIESSSAKESIEKDESYEATLIQVEGDTTMFQISDSLEEESITQHQVPISSLEPRLSFSSEPLDVSASWPCAIVSNNPVHSQSVLDCVKNKTNAYQVFDKMSPHKERLKPKTKRKLSLSLKTWMFKFKTTSKRSKSLDVKSFSVEEIAWLTKDSKEIYRSCVDKELKKVVAGCGKKLFARFQIVEGTSKPAVYDAMDSNIIKHISSSSRATFGYKWIAHYSGCNNWCGWMVFDRGKTNIFSGDVITLVFLANVEVGSKGFTYDGWVILGMNCAGFGRGKSEMLATCPPANENLMELLVMIDACRIASAKTVTAMIPYFGYARADRKTQGCESIAANLVANLITHHDGEEILWMLLFWSTSFKKRKFGKNWWYKFKHGLWPSAWGRELLEVEILVPATVVDVRSDDVSRREFLLQWQNQDASQNSWMLSRDFVLLYHAVKLEDKLRFEGGSIVMNHHAYFRRKKEESESSKAREASGGNRGFAEKN